MTQPVYEPRVSDQPLPGYSPNPSQHGQGPTNNEWSKTLAEYLASAWANGWRGLPGGWDEDKYGNPGEDDTNGVWSPQTILAFSRYAADYEPGKSTWIDNNMPYVPPQPGEYKEDPATTASRVAAENVDKDIAARMKELGYNYDALDETIKQNARENALTKFSQELDRYAIDAGLYEADQLNKIRQYETDAAMWQTAEQVAAQNYATTAGMFNTGQTVQGQNLRQAGSLASALQSQYDARTEKAIDLRSDPSDIVAREYATRALKGPMAEGVQGYQNVSELTEAIRKLLDWENPVDQPEAPTPEERPEAPVLGQGKPEAPVRPEGDPAAGVELPDRPEGVPGGPSAGDGGNDTTPNPGAPGTGAPTGTDPSPGIPNEQLSHGTNQIKVPQGGGIHYDRFDPRFEVYVQRKGQWVPLGPGETAPGGADIQIYVPQDVELPIAPGGTPSSADDRPGVAGGPSSNIPASDVNIDQRKQYYDQDGVLRWTATQEPVIHNGSRVVEPSLAGMGDLPQGAQQTNQVQQQASTQTMSRDINRQDRGPVSAAEARRRWEARQGNTGATGGTTAIADARTDAKTAARKAREAQQSGASYGEPNGMPTGSAPSGTSTNLAGKKAKLSTVQQRLLDQYRQKTGTKAMAKGGKTKSKKLIIGDPRRPGVPNPELVEIEGKNVRTKVTPLAKAAGRARGAKAYAEGTGEPPNVELPSYDDEAYQNLPSLRYLQGHGSQRGYGKLATGSAKGAFGTRAPEAGSINYGRILDIAKDPDSLGALQSVYKSANRNLAAEVARAKARAPLGQAVQTSIIRT